MSSKKNIISPSPRKKGNARQNKKKDKSGPSTKTIDSFFRPSSNHSLCRPNKINASDVVTDPPLDDDADDEVICTTPSPQSTLGKNKQTNLSRRNNNPLKLKLKRKNIAKSLLPDDVIIISDKSDKCSGEDTVPHFSSNSKQNISCKPTGGRNQPDDKCRETCSKEELDQPSKEDSSEIVKNGNLSSELDDDIMSIMSMYNDKCVSSLKQVKCNGGPNVEIHRKDPKCSSLQVNKSAEKTSMITKLESYKNNSVNFSCKSNFTGEISDFAPTEASVTNPMKRKSNVLDGSIRKKQYVGNPDMLVEESDGIELDDAFDNVDLDLLASFESDSIPPLSIVNDSFVDIDNNDLDDVMISHEEDISVLCTWVITKISVSSVTISNKSIHQKMLALKLKSDNEIEARCILREDWYRMEVNEKDVVYVSSLSQSKTSCILDNTSKHYLVVYPNTLISGTTIASGITCERKAILNERFKAGGTTNKAMFLGIITHELFDFIIQNKGCSVDDIEKRARENIENSKYLESLSMLGIDVNGMIDMQKEYYVSLEKWSKQFTGDNYGTKIDLKIGNEKEDSLSSVHIDDVIDIEENIWSPYYGLKGRIDATVQVTIHRRPALSTDSKTYTLPLEFKTGKLFSPLGSIEHRAQVAVYTLLMSERYNLPIDFGLLLYGKVNHMVGVPRPEQEKRAILIKRNEIARNLSLERRELKLPDLIQNKRVCERCDQNATCMLYFKSLENGDAASSGVDELFIKLTSHLSSEDLSYFAKWYELCILEASSVDKGSNDKYIWKDCSEDREKKGICYSGMVRDSFELEHLTKIFLYKFRRKEGHFKEGHSLKSIPLGCGERVIISEENKKVYNITTGYITDVACDIITVSVDHEVRTISRNRSSTLYRIDKDDTLSNYTTPLSNLSRLFKIDSPSDDKLRRLIINGGKPSFSDDKAQDITCLLQMAEDNSLEDTLSCTQGKALSDVFAELNVVQRSAVERCLIAEDYVIIHGMPGAGKSTTIACLVRALASIGKTVLLSSYTHSAVDTILKKLLKVGFKDFLRIGRSSRVDEKITSYTYEEQTNSFTKVHQYQDFFAKQSVVAATCLSINHPLLLSKRFDYCIVDEASQITQPVCIGPIRNADVFILVGDHNQLPPLVLSKEAQHKGLACSLFKSLSELQHDAVVMLNYQYRMNSSIMSLMNSLVYENHMKCGNEKVANSILELPAYEKSCKEMKSNRLLDIVNPKNPVTFVNTDTAELVEEKCGSFVINKGEASLVKGIVGILLQCGLPHRNMGVISMYRQQVNLIRNEIVDCGGFVEVDTMDKYQGKDKSCIIVSFVRSNSKSEVGELLKDWRRINVAMTRAKTKLILIGSRRTISNSGLLCKLVQLLDSNGWCMDL